MSTSWRVVRNSALIVGATFVFSLLFNAVRPSGALPLLAKVPYQIFTDCPEAVRTATPITMQEVLANKDALFVCACSNTEFAEMRINNAIRVEYDPLFPLDEQVVNNIKHIAETQPEAVSEKLKRIAKFLLTGHMPARKTEVGVIVYGSDFVSVKGLADELASAGVAGVRYFVANPQQLKKAGLQ